MEDLAGIYARSLPELDCHVQLGIAGEKVVHCSFPDEPDETATEDHELLDRIEEYVAGEREDDFADVDVGLTVPTDQRAVLETLRDVSYGSSVEVEALVRTTPGLDPDDEEAEEGEAEDRAAERTVREALRSNPVPILLPDHRVDAVEGATPGRVRRQLRDVEGIGR